jgi:hypothetical protein
MVDAGMPADVAAQPIADAQADLQDTRTAAVSAEALVLVAELVLVEQLDPAVVLVRAEQLVPGAVALVRAERLVLVAVALVPGAVVLVLVAVAVLALVARSSRLGKQRAAEHNSFAALLSSVRFTSALERHKDRRGFCIERKAIADYYHRDRKKCFCRLWDYRG